jgi:hypothetical protein
VIGAAYPDNDAGPETDIEIESTTDEGYEVLTLNVSSGNQDPQTPGDALDISYSGYFEPKDIDGLDNYTISLDIFDLEPGKTPGYKLIVEYGADRNRQFTEEVDYTIEVIENDTVLLTIATFMINIYEISIDPITGNMVKELVDTQELQFVSILGELTSQVPSFPIPDFQGLQIVNLQFEGGGLDYLIIKGDVK